MTDIFKRSIAALRNLIETVKRADCSDGVCCCGDPVDRHSYGSGHGPVDAGDHYAGQAVEEGEAVIAVLESSKEIPGASLPAAAPDLAKPLDMVLFCPACGLQHIDGPDTPVECDGGEWSLYMWQNPPHRSHLCHGCGHIWRPADVPTNGVAAVQTSGKNDSPLADGWTPCAEQMPPEHKRVLWFADGRIREGHWLRHTNGQILWSVGSYCWVGEPLLSQTKPTHWRAELAHPTLEK